MLPDNFNSMVIVTSIETTTDIFSKQRHKLSNFKTPTRASKHLVAKIVMLLNPNTAAEGQLSNKNLLQKKMLLLNKDNLLDSMQPENVNIAHINFKRPMKSYSTFHFGLCIFYWNFLC